VKQVQDQGDLESVIDQVLQGAFPIRESHVDLLILRITALDFLDHLLDDGRFALHQTGPYPLVFGSRRGTLVLFDLLVGTRAE